MPPTPYSASIRPRPRKDGTIAHDVRYRRNGRSESISFDDGTGAARWANILRQVGPDEALALLRSGTKDAATVDQYATTYIESLSGVEGKTVEDYRSFMRLHVSPIFGVLPIDAVTPDTIARWVKSQTDKGAASKSIANRHGFLSAMFTAAVNDGLLAKNPCAVTKIPKQESLNEMGFLSWDEFQELYRFIPDHYKPLILLLATTGLRWGEATALRPGDIDMKALTLRVSRAWKHSSAKGWYIGPPKTTRAKRTVSFPQTLADAIRPLMSGEYLFLNPAGKPIRQSNFWNETWYPARRLANGLPARDLTRGAGEEYVPRTGGVWDMSPSSNPIGKYPRIHDLRHSHASQLIAAGIPMITIQRRLGHESLMTTESVYSHLSPDMLLAPAEVYTRLLALNRNPFGDVYPSVPESIFRNHLATIHNERSQQ